MKTVLFTLLVTFGVGFLNVPTTHAQQRYPVAVGQRHPDFKLPSVTDGQPISLCDYHGKKVLLIHFASW